MTARYCADCRHSVEDRGRLDCHHPRVVATCPGALADRRKQGVDCFGERLRTGWFTPCGRRGALWEAKPAPGPVNPLAAFYDQREEP